MAEKREGIRNFMKWDINDVISKLGNALEKEFDFLLMVCFRRVLGKRFAPGSTFFRSNFRIAANRFAGRRLAGPTITTTSD
jgi:hypothetical protein